jgi:hypothetical protein
VGTNHRRPLLGLFTDFRKMESTRSFHKRTLASDRAKLNHLIQRGAVGRGRRRIGEFERWATK